MRTQYVLVSNVLDVSVLRVNHKTCLIRSLVKVTPPAPSRAESRLLVVLQQ